ncbi:MAG: GNAT family N-acetyltransferase [Rubrivivax sp.]|nr:GNAT family N-acetyltransferase [Rubrivivax sp.]
MRLDELRPGWRTDFILHREGALVHERDDCIVVRTPANPTFYWGNCLLLPGPPRDDAMAHWLARFDAEISDLQPASRHVAIGVNGPPAEGGLPSWQAAGFELIETAVIEQLPGELRAPPQAARGDVQVRPLDLAQEMDAVIALQLADAQGFEPAGYERHRRAQMQRYAAMAGRGAAQWFGVWCDGVLAADCGLVREGTAPGATGRFQHVGTHPHWRRRGLCSALVHAVTRFGFEQWQLARVVMCADPDDVAIGIYERLGYRRIDREWALQLRAPQDRPGDGE